ncbi:hypothetical protein BFM98_14080 [Lysinibacillus sp. AR18-8]|uniref:hypothetical protein n=1 Tax=Lysinibacillus sp. AR18-8 TaxID=1889781 RepID=UPI000824EE55|nr:hypothetical protein [Lysinibacillus sp. AR18-8]OCX63336.1 hypothetical protein BFM98_14080 [Lysinibacillus sp. AR18-8]
MKVAILLSGFINLENSVAAFILHIADRTASCAGFQITFMEKITANEIASCINFLPPEGMQLYIPDKVDAYQPRSFLRNKILK